MNYKPKISIVVPIYNVSKYLEECLRSLTEQTLADIEIVCVDDKSTDNCRELIQQLESLDKRIIPVYLEKNFGPVFARKQGVLRAKGTYILFCDGDDKYLPHTCKTVWDELKKKPVDILQFGTTVNFCEGYSESDEKALEDILKPSLKLIKSDLCRACFCEHEFGYTLWNKAYSGELCKKAYSLLEDEHIVVSEDIYIFFVISYFARSYRGIKEKLYVYDFGAGITGGKYLNLIQFKKHCGKITVVELLKKFLDNQNAGEQYYDYYFEIRKNLISDIVYQWRNCLAIAEARAGYEYLVEKIGATKFVSQLAGSCWGNERELLIRLTLNSPNQFGGKAIKNIGVYYPRMRNGGAEKVIAQLLFLWSEPGYHIVLFTDEEESCDDYKIPENVERIVLPSYQTALKECYEKRAGCWEHMIKKHDIDTILYGAFACHILFWDICLIKSLGCTIIAAMHSMFAGAMWYSPICASFLPMAYRMVDCAVVLSRVDITFWSNYCPVYYIQNPIDLIPKEEMAQLNSSNILWVGRFSEEKRPSIMLEIFKIVHKRIPDATLTIVGDDDSEVLMDALKNNARKLQIENNVEFSGFQLDVSSYYQRASVFAFTSMCEAAPLVLSESKSYGVPIVMFELPNVEFSRDSRGVIIVPQDDIITMADKLIYLLENHDKRHELGSLARESIEEFAQFDVKAAWKALFEQIPKGITHNTDENTAHMLDLLLENVYRGVTKAVSGSGQHTTGIWWHIKSAIKLILLK